MRRIQVLLFPDFFAGRANFVARASRPCARPGWPCHVRLRLRRAVNSVVSVASPFFAAHRGPANWCNCATEPAAHIAPAWCPDLSRGAGPARRAGPAPAGVDATLGLGHYPLLGRCLGRSGRATASQDQDSPSPAVQTDSLSRGCGFVKTPPIPVTTDCLSFKSK